MKYVTRMTSPVQEDYFVPSPFCIPLPDFLDDDFMLPSSMIEEIVSKRIHLNRPFYRIPSPPPSVEWITTKEAPPGHRILVYRMVISSSSSYIIHDYIHVREKESINGWVRKYVAYYHTEKTPYESHQIDGVKIHHGKEKSQGMNPSMNILQSCSLVSTPCVPVSPCLQPLHPRTMKRIKKPSVVVPSVK